MIKIISTIINILANLIVFLVIIDSILSFFLNPFHPMRSALDRVLYPLLAPIRRIVPPAGMFDLSPLILIIMVELVSYALISFLHAL